MCDFALCDKVGPHEADGFRFCPAHYGDHLREQARNAPPRPPRPRRAEPQPCGTHAAYNRHKAAGEDPCFPCALAERLYQRSRPDRRAGARRRAS